MGKGGVVLEGGDRPSLSPAGKSVVNCEIANFARVERSYSPAVDIDGVGNRVAHNEMHGSPTRGCRSTGTTTSSSATTSTT